MKAMKKRRCGFTLIELLVVIGIIALLLSILMPSLARARRAALTVQCASNMRTIMQGVILYANVYKGAFPGSPYTSSAHIRIPGSPTVPQGVSATSSDNNAPGVVSIFDWVSPVAKIMGLKFDEGASGASRRSRFVQFLRPGVFMCPENQFVATQFGEDWGTLPWMSYTTNIDFMLKRNTTGTTDGNIWGKFVGRATDWNMPSGYTPTLTKVGNASEKIYLNEGSRFSNGGPFTYTTSAQQDCQHGGSHSDQRPYVALNFARSHRLEGYYGDRNLLKTDNGGRLALNTFRHGAWKTTANRDQYRTNAAFFDGHVETLSITQLMRPSLHSPRGTELTINSTQVYPIVYQQYFNNVQIGNYICP